MDCFGTYFTHVQTCDDVRVQSATEWTASVHTLHMSKPVMTFVFKVLWNGLLRDITTQYYSSTTPYQKVLLQHYAVLLHYYPSLAGRPGHMEAAGRPAGKTAGRQDCRPAGRGQNSEQIHGAIQISMYIICIYTYRSI